MAGVAGGGLARTAGARVRAHGAAGAGVRRAATARGGARARRRLATHAAAAAAGLPAGVLPQEVLAHAAPARVGKTRVAVLLSGGVDSSVALAILRAAGHDVVAFYLQIWFQEDFENFWGECPWEEDLRYAQETCDALGVELRTVPLTKEYWERVVEHSIGEIRRGRTPNPDVLCNSRVKFGCFYDYLDNNTEPGEFGLVASGHYARVLRAGDVEGGAGADASVPTTRVAACADSFKDQTYFLANLRQEQVKRALFPLAGLQKAEVRGYAERFQLPTAGRKDSQGICFLGKVKFSEFVARHLGETKGDIVEAESGEKLGEHRGFWFHTVGQRQGLGLGNGPWYVVRKDPTANVVYVSKNYYASDKKRDSFEAAEFNWLGGAPPEGAAEGAALTLSVKVRHGEDRYEDATVHFAEGGERASVSLPEDDQGLAPGQYAVFYDGDVCLGCGIIQAAEDGSDC